MSLANDQLHSVIKNFSHLDVFLKSSLYLVRRDGLVLYSSGSERKEETQSIGALLGGLWQAAEALSGFVPDAKLDREPFRLSFDSSSKGIFVLPLVLGKEDYFISVIFNETINPAPLKNKLRSLKNHLKEFEEKIILKENKPNFESDNYLFQNITDEEMDNIFSYHGN